MKCYTVDIYVNTRI